MAFNAVGESGSMPPYAENCTAVIAATFSSGSYPERYMVTTKPGGKCTNAFSGTSSSAAVAGGVVALMLDANPRWIPKDHYYVQYYYYDARPDSSTLPRHAQMGMQSKGWSV